MATVKMGGAGDLSLIHAAARLSGARRAVETGVAYGWSSLAILAALAENRSGHLASVDMPYAKLNNEPFVGIVVTNSLRPMDPDPTARSQRPQSRDRTVQRHDRLCSLRF